MHHDPEEQVHLLREHLASHDKRIVFLFGAGTSASVNVAPAATEGGKPKFESLIPAVVGLTDLCRSVVAAHSESFNSAWKALDDECRAMDQDPDIEAMLGRLRLKTEAAGPTDSPLGLNSTQLTELDDLIRKSISEITSPAESDIPADIPHDRFARWVGQANRAHPVEIFTTNYDLLIERSLERQRVPHFDGFVGTHRPYFSPDAVESTTDALASSWTRLWKIHGSVNWSLHEAIPVRVRPASGGDMILPSHRKYDESRKMPYLALMDRLGRSVSAPHTLLVTCGYGWNDQHVNATILTALASQPTSAAIALMFESLSDSPNLVELALRHRNLTAIGQRDGVVRGQQARWGTPFVTPRPTASFLDRWFDSDAEPEDDPPVEGRMRLGDFNAFCSFLEDIEAGRA